MSAKDSKKAKEAKTGAEDGFGAGPVPSSDPPVLPCEKKHWFGVRLVDDAGKPVALEKVKIKLSDGTVQNVRLDKAGNFKTKKILPAGSCQVWFPDLFDVEWKSS